MEEGERTTILFFDDWYLAQREYVTRHVGRPRLVGRFVDPFLDVSWGYPTVFQDRESGKWRCLYEGMINEQHPQPADVVNTGNKLSRRFIPVVIESPDGLDWQVPDLTDIAPLPDRRTPHQVLPLARFADWGPPFYDEQAEDPGERLKGFVSYGTKDQLGPIAPLWVSPDGIHWRHPEGASWHPVGIDPTITAFWNHVRQSYVLAARPSYGDRRMAVYETRDWRTYSKLEMALQADALDTPLAQIYGMPTFPYEGIFIGFTWLFHPDQRLITRGEEADQHVVKGYLGTNDCQLAYSLNGWHFLRGLRDTFIGNSEPGEAGASLVYPSSLVRDGDVLRISSSSSGYEHWQSPRQGDESHSALLFHELRLDGFVYLRTVGGWGSVATRPMFADGPELSLNVEAPHGEVQVQIMDKMGQPLEGLRYEDCIPFNGDSVRWSPEWRDGRRFGAVGSRVMRIGVRMLNARLYAIRGDFYVSGYPDMGIFEASGTKPRPNSSYWT